MEISWADHVKTKVLHSVKGEKKKFFIQLKGGRLNALVTSCVVTAVQNTLLKEIQKGREDEDAKM